MPDADALFEPLTFPCGATAPNRVWLAALTNGQSNDDGTLGDDELRWLTRRAAGGFGVITTCAAYVARDGKAWVGELGVDDDRGIPRLRTLATAVHDHGALALAQIFHGGVRAAQAQSGEQPWSATTWTEEAPDFEVPRPATEADLARVIAQFAAAARRCVEAGLDGVEIHGAHGYLPSQFLSRTFNTRDDHWGGAPIAQRARLMRTIVQAVRAATPSDFIVGVRLSPEDFGHARGLDLDENVEVARWLCDDGADYIHLSLWRAERNTTKRPDEHALQNLPRRAAGRPCRSSPPAPSGPRPTPSPRASAAPTPSPSAAPPSSTPTGPASPASRPGNRAARRSPPPSSPTSPCPRASSATCASSRTWSPTRRARVSLSL